VAIEGFGSLVRTADGIRGEDQTWAAVIRSRGGGLGPVVDAGLVPRQLADRASVALADHEPIFAAISTGRLLHGDFHPRHLYARGGSITGIIDWGDATSGDPVYDFARILHSGTLTRDLEFGRALVDAARATYGDAAWLDTDVDVKLLVYAAVFIVWSMRGEYSGGAPWAPWWPIQCEALSAILNALDYP